MRLVAKESVDENSARWLLIELKNAHRRVLSCLAQLDKFLAQPTPDLQSYLGLRSELSSASRERSEAVQAAHDHIVKRADQDSGADLAKLLQARRQMMGLSADHLSTWNGWMISANRSRHRSAQRALRSYWIDLIEMEQSLLYPMLENDAGWLAEPSGHRDPR